MVLRLKSSVSDVETIVPDVNAFVQGVEKHFQRHEHGVRDQENDFSRGLRPECRITRCGSSAACFVGGGGIL
jgi:hypothetical protein